MMIVNPGSRMAGNAGKGWTNTYEKAREVAERWLAQMHADGLTDIVLLDGAEEYEGRWRFTFRHTVTGVEQVLETHGIDNLDAYERQYLFPPRIYWRGSSVADPSLEDFAADGFEPVKTYRPKPAQAGGGE